MEKKKQTKDKITFENALKRLEDIANRLEDGSLGLEESIVQFETGVKLAKFCHDKLEEAEQKIEILQKGGNDEIKSKNIKIKEDSGEIEEDDEMQGTLL